MDKIQVEYEAKFLISSKEDARQILQRAGAKLIRPEYLQKRVLYDLPKGHEIQGGRLRVRDEGDKTTMSLKISGNQNIESQKEICLEVDNFGQAQIFLESIGAIQKSFIESKRELWQLDQVQITIDEWPFLEAYIEIESDSEASVKQVAQKLGFGWTKAIFGSASQFYSSKYQVSEEVVNNTLKITFSGKNPFINS